MTSAAAVDAVRESLRRASTADLSRKQWRVLAGALEHLLASGLPDDRVFAQSIADIARVHVVDARAALVALDRKGVLVWCPQRGRPRGEHPRSLLGFSTDDRRTEDAP